MMLGRNVSPDLSAMTKAELTSYAESLGVTVRSAMTKTQIIESIEAAL